LAPKRGWLLDHRKVELEELSMSTNLEGFSWKGYGRPDCKLTLRINPDPHTRAEALIHEWHAETGERAQTAFPKTC